MNEIGLYRAQWSDQDLDDLVLDLQRLSRRKTLEYTLEVGELIVRRVFGGDLGAIRSRGRKAVTFRRLASHPDLPFSPTALWRSVAIYELTCRLPEVMTSEHLGLCHLRAVLVVPPERQRLLLDEASERKWSAEKLMSVVEKTRERRKSGGVRPSRTVSRVLRAVSIIVNLDPPAHCESLDSDRVAADLRAAIGAARARLDQWEMLITRGAELDIPRELGERSA